MNASAVKRFSFLKRRDGMLREAFSDYYEHAHGPLAARMDGFRRFTYAYEQNHVVAEFADPNYDGITVTFQRPRQDMTRGFFQESDYWRFVRPDEERLFDLNATRAVLATERLILDRARPAGKAILAMVVAQPDWVGLAQHADREFPNLDRLALSNVQGAPMQLGGAPADFPYNLIVEAWASTSAQSAEICAQQRFLELLGMPDAVLALPVREVVMFRNPADPAV